MTMKSHVIEMLPSPPLYKFVPLKGPRMSTRQRIRQVIMDAEKALEALDRYGEDEYEVGAALMFTKQFRGDTSTYTYIVLKAANGRWYPTGNRRPDMTWSELCDFLAEPPHPVHDLWLVSEYVPVDPT